MKPFTYILIDFLSIALCLVFSFHPRIQFHKNFVHFFKASIVVAVPFIAWDIWFTQSGIWWFNHNYTIGIAVAGLPLEEWLFFLCIPFACVFTLFVLETVLTHSAINRYNALITWTVMLVCTVVVIFHHDKTYPLLTAVVTLATLFYLHFIEKANWITNATFGYVILLPGFFGVNGVLTGYGLDTPIVNYNSSEILNIRILTIPIEDAFYGYSLFLLNWFFFNYFRNKSALRSGVPRIS